MINFSKLNTKPFLQFVHQDLEMKIKHNLHTLWVFSLFLIISSKSCCGANYQYEACVRTANCGSGPTISFPFFIPEAQESYCGYPNFIVSCRNGVPFLQLSENEENDYIIQDIFYHNRSLRVFNSAALSAESGSNCPPRIRNTTLPAGRFDYVSVTSFHQLSDCKNNVSEELSRYEVSCEGSRSNGTLAMYEGNGNLGRALENCGENVVAPAEFVGDERENELSVDVAEVLRRGFLMNWTASDCNLCQESGGRCGFDEASFHFKCFCPDRPHSRSCKPEEVKNRIYVNCDGMERYFKKARKDGSSSSHNEPIVEPLVDQSRILVELDLNDIIGDPGLRKPIEEFEVALRDQVRREYLIRGPCQPIGHMYPRKKYGSQERSFQDSWYQKYSWLEYSVSKDAAFCFWCYLFKYSDKGGRYAEDAFTKTGCDNWKKALEKFNAHVGNVNSCHNNARIQLEAFRDQRHSVANMFRSNARDMDEAYRARLTVSLNVTRLLLKQGLPFRGHDESADSFNRGNFLEVLMWFSQHNDEVSKVLGKNAPANCQMTSPHIQKDLAQACASEITLAIINEIGDKVFTILVDEARDISLKEQMGVVLRFVNDKGYVVERFLGIVHVADTTSRSLKCAIDNLFAKHGLSLSKLRGQGYDGASNMRGEFNGLKSLILQENPYAIYIHCFSHQLQLIVVAVAKGIRAVKDFFNYVSMIVNTAGASCKRNDQLRELEHERLIKQLDDGELISGRGKNQETSLKRPGDTRWGSHYFTLLRLFSMWSSIEKVLENVRDDATCSDNRSTAAGLIENMDSYEFVFMLHLMKYLLGITNELSLALQKKNQNIVQAMSLIQSVKKQLQSFREHGWEIIFDQANKFCESHNISKLDMEAILPRRGYKRHGAELITNLHHYRVEIFYQVVDLTIHEMDNRFSEVSTDLLRCITCIDPKNSFSQFDSQHVMRLATLYQEDFSPNDCKYLPQHLSNFIANVRCDPQFLGISNLGTLAQKMVETGKHLVFPLVYRIIELALVLPVATASVERAFSAMKTVKTDLRNRMGDEWMNNNLVVYIEKEIFSTIDEEKILQRFQEMKTRKLQLPACRHFS